MLTSLLYLYNDYHSDITDLLYRINHKLEQRYDITTQLTTIPQEIGQLTNLQELDLSNNQLTTIPQEIKRMNIQYYDFDKN